MNPLATLYGGVVRARNALYERSVLKPRRLQGPVVSIGNLAVGGSGKTPFLIVLGELLTQRGIPFDVLSQDMDAPAGACDWSTLKVRRETSETSRC